jgi:hypothetical protein
MVQEDFLHEETAGTEEEVGSITPEKNALEEATITSG